MKPTLLMWCVALGACLGGGCVERRYVVTTEPPGVQVLRNGQDLGAAPVDDHFVYYGLYHFTLIKDGYEMVKEAAFGDPWPFTRERLLLSA